MVRPFLFRFDAEYIHNATIRTATRLSRSWFGKTISSIYGFEHPVLQTNVLGIHFLNPVGLAAGYDKKGECVDFFGELGFGFIEVGTVTPRPQAGQAKPRLFHLPREKALLNRMGFNNEGVQALAERLRKRKSSVVVGANIGKNKDTPNELAWQDYAYCSKTIAPLVDYVVVNVSSPNTPGLRKLQEKASLEKLLETMQTSMPLFVKIAPELSPRQLDEVVQVLMQRKNTGIIATNTLKQVRQHVGEGGISGKPLAKRSCEVVRYLYQQSSGQIPIIGVGGIFSAQDAYEKIKAGASLVQVYTGLIYEGPGIVKSLLQGLAKLLLREGFSSLGQAVGTAK